MPKPIISIVIASHNSATVIGDCLDALQRQQGRDMAEIIVADSSSDGTVDLLRSRFSDIRLLHFSKPLTIPQLRGAAIAKAKGEIIAILDSYCIASDRWLTQLHKAHSERPEPVVGGRCGTGSRQRPEPGEVGYLLVRV